jgi:hypothetical protein
MAASSRARPGTARFRVDGCGIGSWTGRTWGTVPRGSHANRAAQARADGQAAQASHAAHLPDRGNRVGRAGLFGAWSAAGAACVRAAPRANEPVRAEPTATTRRYNCMFVAAARVAAAPVGSPAARDTGLMSRSWPPSPYRADQRSDVHVNLPTRSLPAACPPPPPWPILAP